jgi:hypothetical protein
VVGELGPAGAGASDRPGGARRRRAQQSQPFNVMEMLSHHIALLLKFALSNRM